MRSMANNAHEPEAQLEQNGFKGARQVSSLKSELVRNKLVTRTDLMRLYQPPMKRSQIPANNPFFTRTLIKPNQ